MENEVKVNDLLQTADDSAAQSDAVPAPEAVTDSAAEVSVPEEIPQESEAAPATAAAPEAEGVSEELEDIPEAVVPADAGELEREARAEQDPQPRPERRPVRPRARELDTDIGTKSDEIKAEEARRQTAAEEEDENFRMLQRYQRNKEILWGTVMGVDDAPAPVKDRCVINVMYNNVTVAIPETEYFEDTYDFGDAYADMDDKRKLEIRKNVVLGQQFAVIPFILRGVSRRTISDQFGEFGGQYMVSASGSRRDAMALIRDIWFIHSGTTHSRPRTAQEGDIAEAHVISVRENNVLVECLGVETRINAFNMSNEFIDNCRDYFRNGDRIRVRIRKIHINEPEVDTEGNPIGQPGVYLTVSGRLNDANKAILSMKRGSVWGGTVNHYNKTSGIYTVMLSNGVQASVRNVVGNRTLNPGDRVSVTVDDVRDTFVRGHAFKL